MYRHQGTLWHGRTMLLKNPQLRLNLPNEEHTVANVAGALGHKTYLCSNVYLSVKPTLGT